MLWENGGKGEEMKRGERKINRWKKERKQRDEGKGGRKERIEERMERS